MPPNGLLATVAATGADAKVNAADNTTSTVSAVVVVRRKVASGPILVLVGLKYRGNVGTIFRTAVQANCFESIYIIEPEDDPEDDEGSQSHTCKS